MKFEPVLNNFSCFKAEVTVIINDTCRIGTFPYINCIQNNKSCEIAFGDYTVLQTKKYLDHDCSSVNRVVSQLEINSFLNR